MVKNALKVLSKSGEGFTQTDGAGQISIKPGQEEALAAWASALEPATPTRPHEASVVSACGQRACNF